MESGETITQYQPTDAQLSYTEDYGAWFCKGGIGGTIQNPLLRLNEDGSICSRDGSFVIHADGTGHFAGGKFKWTKDDIELTDMTIRWGELDEVAKDQILSQVKPSNIRVLYLQIFLPLRFITVKQMYGNPVGEYTSFAYPFPVH